MIPALSPRTRFGSSKSSQPQGPSRAKSAKLAVAALSLLGAVCSVHAQATWTGTVSQDWNNAANWSTSPSNPTGNFTVNKATGNYPILTGASSFAPVDIFIGTGSGNVGRLDLVNATVGVGPNNTGTTNWLRMGETGGNGTLNVGAGSTFLGRVHMLRTTGSGTATINVSGTITSPLEVVIADGQNNTTNITGVMNVASGGVVNSEGDLIISWAGSSSASGELNIASGATVNVASTVERWLIVNQWDTMQARINVNGGALNLNANTDIRFSPGNGIGVSSITLNSGTITGTATSVLDLNRGGTTVNNTVNLNGGTLTIGQILSGIASGTRVINFNGSTVKAAAGDISSTNVFMPANAASLANVKAGGVVFDSNGFDITVAKGLTGDATSAGGGLTKTGAGKLTLSGVNTYKGNTVLNNGSLALANGGSLLFTVGANGVNSKITGTGSVTIDGAFAFDVSGASTSIGNSWTIFDRNTLNVTVGSTFTVTGFSPVGSKWTKPAAGTTVFQFDPATGILSTVVDPTITFPPPVATAGASLTSYPLGSDIVLRVTATGTGNLTYQWYYKANAGATAQPISGATGATYTISSATAGAGGIYSVTVSDDANGAGSTSATFPAFDVLPGASFAVAQYRFEEGPALATITATQDSVGTNHLTVLGTPNYADDALPYSIIPATAAANTLGVNFPPTGNNGLIAPTSGTLASEPFDSFTIEAFVRLDSLAGWQTIVGRDDSGNPGQGGGPQALFYLSKAGGAVGTGLNNAFRIELIDRSGANLQVNTQTVPVVGTWYHVAAVGDATRGTLTLFVNGVAVGSTTGFTGLFVPSAGSDTSWTLGRGDYNAGDVDFLRGDLDEVRFSRAALPPSQFLNSANGVTVVNPSVTVTPGSQTVGVGTPVTLTANGVSNMGGTVTYQWFKDGTLLTGKTSATLVVDTATTAGSGVYKVVASDNKPGYVVSSDASTFLRVISLPASGRRSIGLNFVGAGSGNWSDVISVFAPGDVAGVYPAANWNNSAAVSNIPVQTTPLALTESNGSTGFASATWASANTWAGRIEFGGPEVKSEHGRLIHGYIESRASTGATVNLTNIPYGTYDVIVYVSGGTSATNVGSVTLNRAEAPTYYYRVLQNDTSRPAATPTVAAPYAPLPMIGDATDTATAIAAAPATFVRFTGVTGSDLVITGKDAVLNANAGGIAAVQIVDTTPAGTAYPPIVTSAPVSKLVKGGANVSFTVSAVAQNAGGTLSYQWQKDGGTLSGQNSSTLSLNGVTGTSSGNYTVVVTETSSLGTSTTTSVASLVVVDSARSVLINGDLGTATASTMSYSGVLLPDGSVNAASVGTVANSWNNIETANGSASRSLSVESSGLKVGGLTLAYTGVEGSVDNIDPNAAAIDNTNNGEGAAGSGTPILRDFAYTDNQTTPMTMTVGGLQAFAGHRFKLVVYAAGASSTFNSVTNLNDAATVALGAANNYQSLASAATDNSQGRDLRYNSQAFVAFEGVVSVDGTVSWTAGADVDGGRIPMNAFQLLVTGDYLAPAAPTALAATAGDGQVALSWTAPAGTVTSYTIRRGTASGVYSTISAGSVTGTTFTDTTVTNGTTYYYVVAAANGIITGQSSNEVSATPNVSVTALQAWRQSFFGTTANSGNAANTADPDADGQSNLLEYALGTNPTVAGALPVTVGRSGNALTLSFNHVGDATLTYTVEASNDLVTWTTAQTYTGFTTAAATTYTDTVSLATQTRRFLRLVVTAP